MLGSYKDSHAYARSNRPRVNDTRPVWPLTDADVPSRVMREGDEMMVLHHPDGRREVSIPTAATPPRDVRAIGELM